MRLASLFHFVLCLSLLSARATAFEIPHSIEKRILKNKLTVILAKDFLTDFVSFQTWIRSGAGDERQDQNGVAHFFEHLFFKGTPTVSVGAFDRMIEEVGGFNNAITDRDFTHYYSDFPLSSFLPMVNLEADRFFNVQWSEAIAENEKHIILEERVYRVDDSVPGLAREALWEMAYANHPYGSSVIGKRDEIKSLKGIWARDYFERHYTPSNVVLVVAGQISSDQFWKAIEDKYGKSKAEPKALEASDLAGAVARLASRAKRTANQKVIMSKASQVDWLSVGFKIPGMQSADRLAFDLLSYCLTEGQGSVLSQKLTRRGIASEVESSSFTLREGGLFVIDVRAQRKVSAERVLTELNHAIQKIQVEGVDEAQLLRAKNLYQLDFLRQFKTPQSVANLIGLYEVTFGDYRKIDSDFESILKLDVKALSDAAKKYFNTASEKIVLVHGADHDLAN